MGMALKNAINGLEHMAAPFKRFFNMVEVTLALAVVGIGITGIMGMFPVAIQSSRDAVADNYICDVAPQFMSYYENVMRSSWPGQFSAPSVNDTDTDDGSLWTYMAAVPNIYRMGTATNQYGIKLNGGADLLAHIRIWATPISDFNVSGTPTAISDAVAVKLCIEISWPTTKQYQYREKRYFAMDIFK